MLALALGHATPPLPEYRGSNRSRLTLFAIRYSLFVIRYSSPPASPSSSESLQISLMIIVA